MGLSKLMENYLQNFYTRVRAKHRNYTIVLRITFLIRNFTSMASPSFNPAELFEQQLSRLGEEHFLVLLWAATGEYKQVKYNITNLFDDLKHGGITRTKQTAVAIVESLRILCLIDVRDERNRKNIYITEFGAKALEKLIKTGLFVKKSSAFLEDKKS